MIAAAVALAAVAGCSDSAVPEDRLSTLLITLDTTRADVLGCYRGLPGITPNLDALAKECVVYDAARSVAPLTQPAHASMMTGLYPPRHTMRDNGLAPLPSSAATLAESARDAGFETAAFVSAVVLDRSWGLAQGFTVYDQPASDPLRTTIQIHDRPASETWARAKDWLAKRDKKKPFFLWIHFFDPHSPCVPPKEFLDQANGNPYLGEVSAMDHTVGEIVASLRAEALLERTLLFVVADHGEALGQHGEPTHSTLCYETTIHVPMLVRHPDGRRASERSAEIVSIVDVHPTLCDAMRIAIPPGLDGTSLLRGAVPEDRGVYFESYCGYLNFDWSPLSGFADRRGKYLHSSKPQFFDTNQDPQEKTDLIAERGADLERYRQGIAAVARRPVLPRSDPAMIDDAMQAQIQALGYAGAGDPTAELPGPLDAVDKPSPQERTKELRTIQRATVAAEEKRVGEAIELLREVIGENPRNMFALDLLAKHLIDENRVAEATDVLRRRHALGTARLTSYLNLARCLESQGDFAGAAEQFGRAFEMRSDSAELCADLVRTLELAGHADEARAIRERMKALEAERPKR
jgi:arylsulfatase A-like enzyme/Tfp pilus assembly protein PilF